MWGSRIIFAWPSKFFTQANKEQQRETIHAVYSVSKNCSEFPECNTIGELRSEPTNLVKISHHVQRSVSVTTDLISSASPAELAMVTYLFTSHNREQTGGNKCIFRLGSGAKIDKFQDLLMIYILCSSTSGADEFRETIMKRWRKLRSEAIYYGAGLVDPSSQQKCLERQQGVQQSELSEGDGWFQPRI